MMARRASYHIHLIAHMRVPREDSQPFEAARLTFVKQLDDLLARMASTDPTSYHC